MSLHEAHVFRLTVDLGPIQQKIKDETEHKRAAQEALIAQERLERERLAQEKLEAERAEQERLVQEELLRERADQERAAQEDAREERLAQERLEQKRLKQNNLAQMRGEQERLGQVQGAQESFEQQSEEQDRPIGEQIASRGSTDTISKGYADDLPLGSANASAVILILGLIIAGISAILIFKSAQRQDVAPHVQNVPSPQYETVTPQVQSAPSPQYESVAPQKQKMPMRSKKCQRALLNYQAGRIKSSEFPSECAEQMDYEWNPAVK